MSEVKAELHPRSKHKNLYDFKELIVSCPELSNYVARNNFGNDSIDFSNPRAVKALNRALLRFYYKIEWNLPEPYLCPPIPGRIDYLHYLADLLNSQKIESKIKVLDIGTGANCIYPLLGAKEYGWHFIGTDIDRKALSIAEKLIKLNDLSELIELRHQAASHKIFEGIMQDTEFTISMCNPPFHASAKVADANAIRKRKNLNIKTKVLNFGGTKNELWCPGGEVGFIKQMIKESVNTNCKWFTTLVSKSSSLPILYETLTKVKPTLIKTINMGQGQKQSRILAWTFKNT